MIPIKEPLPGKDGKIKTRTDFKPTMMTGGTDRILIEILDELREINDVIKGENPRSGTTHTEEETK